MAKATVTAIRPNEVTTRAERRRSITEHCDAGEAIIEAIGTLEAIRGQARMLQQDTVRCEDEWVIAIASAIVELAEGAADLLDRPGGWSVDATN